jgi:hypothetical protein
MKTTDLHRKNNCQSRDGVVLLVTLVLLVVLAMVSYTLSIRVSAQRHRNQYIIDYNSARYGCDSGIKYAVVCLEDVNKAKLIERPNEPDFSDLFALNEVEYKNYLASFGLGSESVNDVNIAAVKSSINDVNLAMRDISVNDINLGKGNIFTGEANSVKVRGPYGYTWPLVVEPVELMIGTAKVTIEVEDENAKYPIGWMMLDSNDVGREVEAGFKTFCEWMGIDEDQMISFETQFDNLRKIKPFKFDLQTIKVSEQTAPPSIQDRRGRVRRRPDVKTITTPATVHIKDFARLYHSSLIDTEILARPTVVSDERNESALKYIGLWGSGQVNINTAPRNVLEAVFMFGGDSVEIADRIIKQRRIKPFADMNEFKRVLSGYASSILKCEKYITMTSKFFTIRVTSTSGVAKKTAIVAVMKNGSKLETIGVISG